LLKDALARLSRHTLVYALAGQASRLLAFLLIPFYLHVLSERDYGINEKLSLLISVLSYLAGINMAGAISRFYFERADREHRNAVVSTAVISVTVASLVVGGLLALCARPLGELIGGDYPRMPELVLVTLGILVLQTVREMLFQYLRTEERSTLFAVLSLSKVGLELALRIWFIVGLGLGLMGLFEAVLIGEALTVLVMACLVLPVTGLRFSRPLFRAMVLFVLPLIPTGLAQFCLHSADRYVLGWLTDDDQVGIYSLAYQFGQIPNYLLLTPFLLIWYPYIFSLADDERRRELIGRLTPYFMFALTACCLGVALLSREALELMTDKPGFLSAAAAVPLVVAGYWLWGLFQLVQTGFYISKQTGRMPALTAVAAVANVGLNVALIPWLGFMGAAWSTLLTFALLLVITVRVVRPVFPVAWPWRRVFVPALAGAALQGGVMLADLPPGAGSIGIKLAAFLGWLAWMYAGGFLGAEERAALAGALRGLLGRTDRR
jgi:O-antigen/teichoic acid export membrane protein